LLVEAVREIEGDDGDHCGSRKAYRERIGSGKDLRHDIPSEDADADPHADDRGQAADPRENGGDRDKDEDRKEEHRKPEPVGDELALPKGHTELG
jgi:hypothetical protein